jgi:hypothetical protein
MLQERREREEETAALEERVAGAITRFSGTLRFVACASFCAIADQPGTQTEIGAEVEELKQDASPRRRS